MLVVLCRDVICSLERSAGSSMQRRNLQLRTCASSSVQGRNSVYFGVCQRFPCGNFVWDLFLSNSSCWNDRGPSKLPCKNIPYCRFFPCEIANFQGWGWLTPIPPKFHLWSWILAVVVNSYFYGSLKVFSVFFNKNYRSYMVLTHCCLFCRSFCEKYHK